MRLPAVRALAPLVACVQTPTPQPPANPALASPEVKPGTAFDFAQRVIAARAKKIDQF